jgi:hypothetical protein
MPKPSEAPTMQETQIAEAPPPQGLSKFRHLRAGGEKAFGHGSLRAARAVPAPARLGLRIFKE